VIIIIIMATLTSPDALWWSRRAHQVDFNEEKTRITAIVSSAREVVQLENPIAVRGLASLCARAKSERE
jgi:hypothetical protein